jgi:two-component system sensor histidine kinase/response regulator
VSTHHSSTNPGGDGLRKDDRNKKRILVAEDNSINQEITVHILLKAGYRVEAVASGLEVLQVMRAIPCDLILMDCQMPEMDGYEATRNLRAQGLDIPIVALTANAFKEDRDHCLAAGMSDYVTKPVSERILIQAVDSWLYPAAKEDSVIDEDLLGQLRALDEDGSQGLIKKLVQVYCATAPKGLADLRAAANQPELLRKHAHYLKSSNANLGVHRAVEILQKIEDGDFQPDALTDLLDRLETEIKKAQEELLRLQS